MNINTTSLYDAANAMVQLKIYDILNRYGQRKPRGVSGGFAITAVDSGNTTTINNTYNTVNETTTIDRSTTVITYEDDGKPGKGNSRGDKFDKKA